MVKRERERSVLRKIRKGKKERKYERYLSQYPNLFDMYLSNKRSILINIYLNLFYYYIDNRFNTNIMINTNITIITKEI